MGKSFLALLSFQSEYVNLLMMFVQMTSLPQDPFQSEAEGWTRNDYYVTGCSKHWISLRLLDEFGELVEESLEGDDAGEDTEGDEVVVDEQEILVSEFGELVSDTEEDLVSDAEEDLQENEIISEDDGEVVEESLEEVATTQDNEEVQVVVCQASSTCISIGSIICYPAYNTPELDGYSDEWENVKVFEAALTEALCPTQYPHGNGSVQIQCVYDTANIYFLFHVPGPYRSSSDENHKNAAMSMMFKMGEMATLPNMVSALTSS